MSAGDCQEREAAAQGRRSCSRADAGGGKGSEYIDCFARIYYWMSGEVKDTDNDLKSDGVAIKKGYVSITPLQLQMTNFDFITGLNEWSF